MGERKFKAEVENTGKDGGYRRYQRMYTGNRGDVGYRGVTENTETGKRCNER